jgi:alpha-mannosidase
MKTIYLVPLAHYDVAWAFTKEDYLSMYEIILNKALEMIEISDFKFVIEQMYPLEQFENNNRTLYGKLKAAIDAGSIEIVDGLYIMPDFMLPGGETIIRQILHGKRYCISRFGKTVPIAWVADSFGLNAQMPQIYKKSGYQWLAFRRGLPKLIGYRASEFIWEGLDGSQITSHWMPLGYRAGLYFEKWEEHIRTLSSLATTDHVLMPCGSGGVPPQEDTPHMADEWNAMHGDIKMLIATPGEFFKNFDRAKKRLAVYSGELYSEYLEHVFPDVASSRISLKLSIKSRENVLILAEKVASLAYMMDKPYPREEMTELWKKMLFLTNHDIMPSTGIDEIYKEAYRYLDEIEDTSRAVVARSLAHLINRRSDATDNQNILVFNPYNWEVTDWTEVEIQMQHQWTETPGLTFADEEVPTQLIREEKKSDGTVDQARLGFVATVPPMGYRVYNLCKKHTSTNSSIRVKGSEIATDNFRLRLNDQNGIIQVFDKEGFKILEGNELVMDEEVGDLYFHESPLDRSIASESGKGMRFGAFKPESCEIKQGPLKTVIEYKSDYYCLRWPYYLTEKFGPMLYRHKTIAVSKQVIIYNDLPRIDFFTSINLQQSHVRIRLRFDTCMVSPLYTRQTQFGAITLPQTRTLEQGVHIPAPFWISSEEGNRGIAFLTPGVPVNEVRAGEIYYTLLRSVSVLSADGVSGPLIPTPDAMELGDHSYFYSVYMYNGNWRDMQIHREAYEYGQPLSAMQWVHDVKDRERCFMKLDPDNLIISALKKAEDEEAIIVRFFETKGAACEAVLSVPPHISSARTVNLLEEDESEVLVKDNKVRMEVKPFEIVSLKLSLHT